MTSITRGGKSNTCIGGWQWGVSSFSTKKEAALKLAKFMSSQAQSKYLATEASLLPVFPGVYTDPDVLKVAPWFKDALPVVEGAKSRPVTPRYNEVSEIIRTTINAVLSGAVKPDAAADDIEARLKKVLR